MKKLSKIVTALALSACLSVGVIGFTACTSGEPGKSAYEIAVENGFEGTEAEWLESLKVKGDKGDPGDPGEKGDKGDPGDPGDPGTPGEKGNGWLYGNGEPSEEQGRVGDLYLDLDNGDVWTKEADEGWVKSELNLKGGSEEEDSNIVKDFGHKDIAPDETAELSFEDVEDGTYYLVAETSDKAAKDSLCARWENYSYDMYSTLYTGYTAVIIVRDGVETVTLNNTSQAAMSLDVTLVPFVVPTITAGKAVEIPSYYQSNTSLESQSNDYIAIPLDTTLQGQKVKITITNLACAGYATVRDNTDSHGIVLSFTTSNEIDSEIGKAYAKEVDLSQDKFKGITEICLVNKLTTGTYHMNINFLIKIELVES